MSFHKSCFEQKDHSRIVEEYIEYEMVKLVKRLVKKFPFESDLEAMKFLHGYFKRNPYAAYVSGK